MMLVYTLILLCVSHIVAAFRNISLDDSNPAIVYHGNWLETPYDPTNKGGHHMVTADTNAYATLAFTGIAIYFYSPLWPFRVTTAVTLDGDTPELLDLRDYDVPFQQDGPECANSSIVWYTDGLDNTPHLLNVSVGAGEDLAILDYLMYTIVEPGDPSITQASVSYIYTRSVSISSSASVSPQATLASSSSTKLGLSITLGLVCLIFSSIVFWALFWWWKRRNRRRLDETSTISSHDHSNMLEATHPTFPRTTGVPSLGKPGNFLSDPRGKSSRRSGPFSSRHPSSRLAFAGVRGARNTFLTPIPEISCDRLNGEYSPSQGSSTTTSTATGSSSPGTSVKNDTSGDLRNDFLPQSDSQTVRLVPHS